MTNARGSSDYFGLMAAKVVEVLWGRSVFSRIILKHIFCLYSVLDISRYLCAGSTIAIRENGRYTSKMKGVGEKTNSRETRFELIWTEG